MESVFQKVIAELNREGRTVLLSSHILAEVEALCDRVTIIRSGKTVSTGTLEELRSGTLTTVEATTGHRPAGLEGIDGVTELQYEDHPHGVRIRLVATHAAMPQAVAAVTAAEPTDLVVRPPSLEQLFLEHYQESGPGVGQPNQPVESHESYLSTVGWDAWPLPLGPAIGLVGRCRDDLAGCRTHHSRGHLD